MSLYDALVKRIKQSLAFPQFMRIDVVHIEKSVGGYNADGELVVLTADGGFGSTGEVLKSVPICIPAATNSGAGLYAQADADQIAVVQYIDGNKAYPIVTGYYTDEYEPAADDTANISLHAGEGTVRIASKTVSLFSVMDNIIDALMKLKTQGGPSNQVISPDTITSLQKEKTRLAQVLKE